MTPDLMDAVKSISSFEDFDDFKEQLRNQLRMKSLGEFNVHALRGVFDMKVSML